VTICTPLISTVSGGRSSIGAAGWPARSTARTAACDPLEERADLLLLGVQGLVIPGRRELRGSGDHRRGRPALRGPKGIGPVDPLDAVLLDLGGGLDLLRGGHGVGRQRGGQPLNLGDIAGDIAVGPPLGVHAHPPVGVDPALPVQVARLGLGDQCEFHAVAASDWSGGRRRAGVAGEIKRARWPPLGSCRRKPANVGAPVAASWL